MSVTNFWGDPCPVCKRPITDRESPYAVLCAGCINDALLTVLSREQKPASTLTTDAPTDAAAKPEDRR